MKYALFLGCRIPADLPAYEASTRAVLGRLGVTLVDLPFACCGYPARSYSREAFVVAAIRNLALAERAGLDVLTPCMCCFGTLRHAMRFVDEDSRLRGRVADALAAEGLAWSGKVGVTHVLPLLARLVREAGGAGHGSGERIAAHYGCHALRPGDVTGVDNPFAPSLFEGLLRASGTEPVDWPRRLDCCGDPLHAADPPVSERMTQAKLVDAAESGAQAICTACPHCHLRFADELARSGAPPVRALLVTQVVGLAMGLPASSLGVPAGTDRPRAADGGRAGAVGDG
jgi:heterodisulfide reductase subunit B